MKIHQVIWKLIFNILYFNILIFIGHNRMDNSYWKDISEIITEFLEMIPQQLLACAAIKIGAYARGLRYLELQARQEHLQKRSPHESNVFDISCTGETDSNPNNNIAVGTNNEEKESSSLLNPVQSWNILMPLMKWNDYANGALPPLNNEIVNSMMEIYARLGDADALQVISNI